MKNISRRVFIKGMAVAAVATAASTVLTGCKLPVGTTEEPEVVPVAAETLTFTNQANGKSANVVIDSVIKYDQANKIVLPLKVENNLNNPLTVGANATTGNYGLVVSYKGVDADGIDIVSGIATDATTTTNKDNLFVSGGTKVEVAFSEEGVLVISTPSGREWKEITVTFTLNEYASSAVKTVATKEYVIKA